MKAVDDFSLYAEEYDRWYSKHREVYESEILAIKALKLEGLGLDVGVGTGALSHPVKVAVGIDPSLPMLKIAKGKGIEVVRAVGEYPPFRDSSFKYILMSVTFCFLDEPGRVLSALRRLLPRDGYLALCIVPRDSPWGRLYMEKASKGHRFYRFAKFYTFDEVSKILEETGFSIVSVKATLSYSPRDKYRVEEAASDIKGKGFICIKSIKTCP